MAWSTIRKATEEDRTRLARAAEEFAARHRLQDAGDPELTVSCAIRPWRGMSEIEHLEARHLRHLWRRIVRRALHHHGAQGIAWGYVGRLVS